jgi:hypothetical protein
VRKKNAGIDYTYIMILTSAIAFAVGVIMEKLDSIDATPQHINTYLVHIKSY